MVPPKVKIQDLGPKPKQRALAVAQLLVEGFRGTASTAWLTLEDAQQEVRDSFGAGRMSRVALAADGTPLGWIGGLEQYEGHAWELHPLVVHPAHQLQGIGSALVLDFEEQVRARGATMIWLGTDDEDNQTSLGGEDLYPDVLERLSGIRNLRRHPYEFYQKLGYVLVGIFPDANGPGKPDILMAKRVGSFPSRNQESMTNA